MIPHLVKVFRAGASLNCMDLDHAQTKAMEFMRTACGIPLLSHPDPLGLQELETALSVSSRLTSVCRLEWNDILHRSIGLYECDILCSLGLFEHRSPNIRRRENERTVEMSYGISLIGKNNPLSLNIGPSPQPSL
jgi:hypothetical protein